jgi:hypothetical protein
VDAARHNADGDFRSTVLETVASLNVPAVQGRVALDHLSDCSRSAI